MDWEVLNPSIFATMLDISLFFFHNRECSFMRRVYFFSQTKEPVMYHTDEVPFDPNEIQPNDSEVVCLIKELIET